MVACGSTRPRGLQSLEVNLKPKVRAASYIALLLALNCYFAGNLFLSEFTNNMQTNAGSFMAITRFILQHWPHLGWYPWWDNGEPFENSYTPMLHLVDAAFAWITGASPARAFNFVTGAFFVFSPVFLFYFAWRISGYVETSFFAALLYSLFSPSVMFSILRADVGTWNPWHLRTLVSYGEGPHNTVLSILPLVFLAIYLALTTRKYVWCAIATLGMAFITLINAFAAVDLLVGCTCLILALPKPGRPPGREILKASLLTLAMGAAAYLLASPFLTPTLLRTVAADSQYVGAVVETGTIFAAQSLLLPGFVFLYFAIRRVDNFLIRFSVLFTYMFFEIVALWAVGNVFALPQPNRYSLEMEWGLPLVAALALRRVVIRWPPAAKTTKAVKAVGIAVILLAAYHQTVAYRRYARFITQKIDVTQTIEYKTAQWFQRNMPDQRAFVAGDAGFWLNVFADTPQMQAGHMPFNPNFWGDEVAAFTIYSGMNAGSRDADYSILWLRAYGCQAIYVPGPMSRLDVKPFVHPKKFEGMLPVLWHEEDDTIYGVPQRTKSLGHVVPESAIVKRKPIHGLDTAEVERYVGALNDASLPTDVMVWLDPNHAHIDTTLHPGQVLSIQSTYDKGWIATANGKPAAVTRDEIGLSVVHAACDGAYSIDFIFDGGLERKVCRALSWLTFLVGLAGGVVVFRLSREADASHREHLICMASIEFDVFVFDSFLGSSRSVFLPTTAWVPL